LKNYIIKGIVTLLAIGICVSISLAAPAAPTITEVTDAKGDDGGNISITWDLSVDDNVTIYDILRNSSSEEDFKWIDNTNNNETKIYIDHTTDDGVDYWYIVNATDGTNSSSSDPKGPVQSEDDKKPVISLVENGTVTNSTAIITWKTHENSTSRVEYGTDSTSDNNESRSLMVKSHEINLTGLNPSTTYKYIVESIDGADNSNVSEEKSFTTASDTTVDNIKPTVNETNPGNVDTDIDITADITVTFSEKMNVSTLDNNSFYVKNSSDKILGIVTYDSFTKNATFDPKEDLDYNTTYTATVTTDVTDLVGNGLNENETWSFTTEHEDTSNNAPTVEEYSVDPTSGVTPVTFNFSVTIKDVDNDTLEYVYLYIKDDGDHEMEEDDSSDQVTSDGKDYVFSRTISDVGTYEYYFKASDGNETVVTDEKELVVNSKTYSSGNRIWDEDTNLSTTYEWNPQSFSGFYYDLDTNEGSETLTIENIDRSLKSGEITYETSPISIDFEQDIWETYEVIGFMADRYFAGYTDNTTFASSDESLLDERQLSKVLLDTDKKYNLRSGSSLELEEGYELRIAEFGSEGNAVMVALFKNSEKVTEDIVNEGDTFVYEKDLGDADDIPIIAIYFDNVFVGTETSTIIIEGIFQVSDNYIDVSKGDEFGLMEIDSVSSSGIKMENEDSVSLGKGDDFNLMGKINIIVADHDTLRFAPYVDMSEPGTYELRGTVTKEETFEWTPFNFEGLLYDIDTGDGKETLEIVRDGKSVDIGDLTYTTKPISMNFEHSGDGWDTFQSIGFMGDTYFAGYLEESSFVSSDRSLIKEGRLSKILIDEDEKHTLHIGNSLTLEEGYSLRIDEISREGDAIMIALLKDGEEISTDIISGGDTYIYEVEVDKTDIPIIVAHIDRVFRGMETNSVFVEGLFQISESFTTVEEGDTYGIMEVETLSSSSIVLENEDDFSLDKGDIINIMGEIKFKVADSSDVRFYPFQEIIVEEPLFLDLDIPESVYENEEFTISVTSDGDEVEDVSITFDDSEIGTTDSDGELIYTPIETGEFKVTASKSGYGSDSEDIEILYQPKLLEISAPLLADKDETIVISVTSEGKSVSGVTVMFGSNDLGTTPASGNITHTPDQIGTHTITASKSGYQDTSKDIDITDPGARLVYSNLTIEPKSVQPGENVNITVEAANFGTLRDADTMTIKVNGEEIATEDLVLGPGEIMTIEFTMNRSKPGTYLVEVDGRSDTFKVMGSQFSSTAIVVLAILAILSITAVIYSFAQGTLSFDIIIGKAQALKESLMRLIEK
jgi:S-layer protein (TIGR01567 family)